MKLSSRIFISISIFFLICSCTNNELENSNYSNNQLKTSKTTRYNPPDKIIIENIEDAGLHFQIHTPNPIKQKGKYWCLLACLEYLEIYNKNKGILKKARNQSYLYRTIRIINKDLANKIDKKGIEDQFSNGINSIYNVLNILYPKGYNLEYKGSGPLKVVYSDYEIYNMVVNKNQVFIANTHPAGNIGHAVVVVGYDTRFNKPGIDPIETTRVITMNPWDGKYYSVALTALAMTSKLSL
jgi:uncharacterized lipoprotein YehR (DUF1307 family)